MRRILATLVLLFLVSYTWADVIPVFDGTVFARLGEELIQMKKEVSLLKEQLNAIKQLDASQYDWSNTQNIINKLGQTLEREQALNYNAQNLDEKFKSLFPGYTPPDNFEAQYKDILKSTLNTLNGNLDTLHINSGDFASENQRLSFLQRQAMSAKGQTQAIQAASQIASENVSQLQLLRQTVMSQSAAQTSYYAAQLQLKASQEAELSEVIGAGSKEIPQYGTSGNYLTIPNF